MQGDLERPFVGGGPYLNPAEMSVEPGGHSPTVTIPSREENRSSTLDRANQAVMTDRNTDYDDPEDNFVHIADMWNAYLKLNSDDFDYLLTSVDVANLMILVKLARITTSPKKQDHWVDVAGYAACGYGCAAELD